MRASQSHRGSPSWPPPSSLSQPRGSPGLHRANAVHGPRVIGASAVLLNVTAVVRLQSRRWVLSLGRYIPSFPGTNTVPDLTPNLHLQKVFVCPSPFLGLNGYRSLRRSGRCQPGPGPGCKGSPAAPLGNRADCLPAPPSPGTVHGPSSQSLSGSHPPGAKPVRAHWSRLPAHP